MNRINIKHIMNRPIIVDNVEFIKDSAVSLELKGFITCINYLMQKGFPVTYESMGNISGLSEIELEPLVEKCIELGVLEIEE